MSGIRVRRHNVYDPAKRLQTGQLGVMGSELYYGQYDASPTTDLVPLRVAKFTDIPDNFAIAPATHAASYIPAWNGTADSQTLVAGFSLRTATGGTWADTELVRADAIKAYVDGLLGANDAMVYKGIIPCNTNPNYPAADAGHVYKVSVAGKIGGSSGPNVEVGDTLLCITDGTAVGTHATVGMHWNILQVNIDGLIVGPGTTVVDSVPQWNNTNGTLFKAGKAISDSDDAAAIGTGTNLVTERDIYYGLPTINNVHNYTSSTSIYAPTGGGTEGQALRAVGATSTPIWEAVSDATANGAVALSSGLTTSRQVYYGLVQVNGSNQTRATTIWVPGASGNLNQILRSGGDGTAPSWNNFSHSLLSDHTIAEQTTGHFLKATGSATFAFEAHGLTHTSVGAAAASHTHGVITSAGFIGEVAGLVVMTGTNGVIEAVQEIDEGAWA